LYNYINFIYSDWFYSYIYDW